MRRAARGFTLVELVITVAILGLLASIAMPLAETMVRRSKEQELKAALTTLRDAIDAYKDAVEAGRVARSAGDAGYPASLQVLVDGVADRSAGAGGKLYFLRRVPRDPFADPTLPAAQTWGLRSSDSPPDAPQPGKDVFDVRSLSEGQALDGTPYRSW